MSQFFVNKWVHFFLLFLLLAGAVFFSGSSHELRKRLQYATFDTFNRLHPREATNQIAIIDLDEDSIKQLGQWPWPRTVMAQIVDELKAMGAKVIAFDVVFAEHDRTSPLRIAERLPDDPAYDDMREQFLNLPDNDSIFGESIAKADNVVTGFTRARPEETLRFPHARFKPTFLVKDKDVFFENSFAATGVATNLPGLSSSAAGNGSFMATPDIDGIIREVSLFVKYPPEALAGFDPRLYPSLALEALRVSINKNARYVILPDKDKGPFDTNYLIKIADKEIPVEDDMKLWVYYRHIEENEYIPAYKLLDEKERADIAPLVEDKIVFIGTSAEGLKDIRSTPLDIFVPGVEVHANIVEQILQGKYLKRPDIIIGVEAIAIGVVGLLIIILAPFINALWLGAATLTLIGAFFYQSWQFYVTKGLLLDPVYPSFALSFLFLVSALLSYLRAEYETRQIRGAFGLYISPDFMEELTKDPDKLKLGGEVRDLTVMFTDIRNFTSISESLTPEELIQLMNDFLTPMSDLVMNHRGTIDKYMGDAMMAFWNAPLEDPDHARNACLTALRMNDALLPINEELSKRAEEKGTDPLVLQAGIGVNTGPCSVGNMGSKQRFAYSALGDSVNLASRLEGQTKTYGVSILAGEETYQKTKDLAWLEMDLIKVKGKEKPVRVFTLIGDEDAAKQEEFQQWQAFHNSMLAAYRAGDTDCAAQELKDARKSSKGQLDLFYDLYAARIKELIQNPPDENWDGVYIATSK